MNINNTRYLLDTSIISQFAKDSCEQHAGLRNWLTRVPEHTLHLPYGAALEIQRGIAQLRRINPSKAHHLNLWFDDLQSKLSFIPMTLEAARIQAEMTSEGALKNLWINDPRTKTPGPRQTLAIAATAIASGSCLVTRNMSDFEQIDRHFPLPGLINPIDHEPSTSPHSAITIH